MKREKPPAMRLEVDPFTCYTLFELRRYFRCSKVTLWRGIKKANVSYSRSMPYLRCRSHRVVIPSWELWKFSNCPFFRKWLKRMRVYNKILPKEFYHLADQKGAPNPLVLRETSPSIDKFISTVSDKVIFQDNAVKIMIDVGVIPSDSGKWIPAFFVERLLHSKFS